MIGFLKGRVHSRDLDKMVIVTNDVGYELHCSKNTMFDFEIGERAEFFVYTHVREDALVLFGFSAQQEKQMFESLIKINGIGPKSAIRILSATSLVQLTEMIDKGDAKLLAKLPKVGKKTAEQMILSLKGKLVLNEINGDGKVRSKHSEIVSALVHLGYKEKEVIEVVEQMDSSLDLQEGVRQALSFLSR